MQHNDKKRLACKILGVPESADAVAIKKAFWLLAMQHHPDKNPRDMEAHKTFRNVVNAYEFLTNKAHDWEPDEKNSPEERIGEYLPNNWGYFCWWRENFE